MKMIFFALFISMFYIAGFYMFGKAYNDYAKSKTALDWPTTTAKVISCELITSYDSESGNSYQVHTEYQYFSNGISYQNNTLAFGYDSSSSKVEQEKILDKLLNAKKIYINYNPEDPQNSVIVPGINKSIITLFLFSITWLAFVIGFTVIWVVSSQEDTRLLNQIRIEKTVETKLPKGFDKH
jgi:hypothetical protein